MLKHTIGALFTALALTATVAATEPSVDELIANLKSNDETVQINAMFYLGEMHEKAAAAAPALAVLLSSKSAAIRANAAETLGDIGAPAREQAKALAKTVADEDPMVRRQAVKALAKIHPGPEIGVPLFVKLMEDSDAGARQRALGALADAGEKAVPFLVRALNNEKAAYWACIVLRDIGEPAKAAVPALILALDDKHPEIRREAILALARMGEPAKAAYPALLKALNDDATATAASFAFAMLGDMPAAAKDKIQANTKSEDKVLQAVSLWALAHGSKDDAQRKSAGTALFELLKDKDPQVRMAAARGLADLKLGPEVALPMFQKAMQGADDEVKKNALEAVAALGPAALPALTKALEVNSLQSRVASLLGEMHEQAADAADELAALLKDEEPATRREAVMALAKIGPGAKVAMPQLIEAIQSDDNAVAYGAAYALGQIGSGAAEAKPALVKALGSDDDTLSLISAWALTEIDPKDAKVAAVAVPVLAKGLADPMPKYRYESAEALKKWGKLSAPAHMALQKATQDEDPMVSEAATDAMKAMHSMK